MITAVISKMYISLPYRQQFMDVAHSIEIGLILVIPLYCVSLLNFGIYWELTVQCALAVILFILGSKLFHFDEYSQLRGTILGFINSFRKK